MDSTAAQELTGISYAILEAIRSRNRAALEEILLPDFVHLNEGGVRQDKGAFLSAIEEGDYQIEHLTFEHISVEHFDRVGVVCGVQRAVVRLPRGERVGGGHCVHRRVPRWIGWLEAANGNLGPAH